MKYLFRCDSSYSVGSGHLVRCLNLALLLKSEVTFICRNLSGNINSRIIQNQFKLIELADIPNYSVEEKIDEITEIENHFATERPEIIIVDHYGLDENWEKAAKKWCKKLISIDDLGRFHNADIILDQNFRESPPQNYIDSNSELFLGPHFSLLSKSFIDAPLPNRDHSKVENILVFFGGSDPQKMTLQLTRLAASEFNNLHWIIVVGDQNKDLVEILSMAKRQPCIEIHINTTEMVQLMSKADLFIGAGGTTSWERAKLGLPSIAISIAKNQEAICEELAKKEIIIYLGKSQETSSEIILNSIKEITENHLLRENLSHKSLGLQVSSKLMTFIKAIESF